MCVLLSTDTDNDSNCCWYVDTNVLKVCLFNDQASQNLSSSNNSSPLLYPVSIISSVKRLVLQSVYLSLIHISTDHYGKKREESLHTHTHTCPSFVVPLFFQFSFLRFYDFLMFLVVNPKCRSYLSEKYNYCICEW